MTKKKEQQKNLNLDNSDNYNNYYSEEDRLRKENEMMREENARLREEAKRIKEEHRIINAKTVQLKLINELYKIEERLKKKFGSNFNNKDSALFKNFFDFENIQNKLYEDSQKLFNKICLTEEFIIIKPTNDYIVVVTPLTEQKYTSEKSSINTKVISLDPPKKIKIPKKKGINKIWDVIFKSKILPYLKLKEIYKLSMVNKSFNESLSRIWRIHLSKLKQTLLKKNCSTSAIFILEFNKQLIERSTKMKIYSKLLIEKLSKNTILNLINDDNIGTYTQILIICFLKFIFKDNLKIKNYNEYYFEFHFRYYLNVFMVIFETYQTQIFNIQENANLFRDNSVIFTDAFIANLDNEKAIDIKQIFAITSSSWMTMSQLQEFSKKFVVYVRFNYEVSGLDSEDVSQFLFLRSIIKQLEVIEYIKMNLLFTETWVDNLLHHTQSMCVEEDIELLRTKLTSSLENELKKTKGDESSWELENKLKITMGHIVQINDHLIANSSEEMMLMEIFLNFPKYTLKNPEISKKIFDTKLSMISAIHHLKKFDSVVDFDLYYRLIHVKIEEMIKKNTEEIEKNSRIKENNLRKIKEIEDKIEENRAKIIGNCLIYRVVQED